MDKAVGYIRLSQEDRNKKDKEELETSLINQEKDVRNYCLNNGLECIEVYNDKYLSGDDPERPDLNRLLQDAKNKKFDVVVIKDLSRLTRNSSYQREVLIQLGVFKIKLISLMGGLENEMITYVLGFVNEIMIVLGRMNARKLMERKRNELKPYITPPFGYKFNVNKEWVVDGKKSEIVKKVFEMTLLPDMDYKSISRQLNISPSLYYKIVRNKNYLGLVCHKKYVKDGKGRIINIEKVEYQGNHPALVSEELFNAVQEKLKNNKLKIK